MTLTSPSVAPARPSPNTQSPSTQSPSTQPPTTRAPDGGSTEARQTPIGANVITTDAKALAVANAVSRLVAHGAAERDAQRATPVDQLEVLSGSGLLGVTVPRVHGGADVSATTLLEVFRRLATADPAVALIAQSHVVNLSVLRRHGTPDQRRLFFAEALAGKRFAGAEAEPGASHSPEPRARLHATGDGYVLRGTKDYATGVPFAQWLVVLARDDSDRLQAAYVPADARGVTIDDNQDGIGERPTASGTVHLDDVRVPAEHVVAHHRIVEAPQLHGALAQALHAAIDAGIADAALADAVEFVRTRSRPWPDAGVDAAVDDPLTAQRVGELTVAVRSAQAVLADAGRALDTARVELAGNPRDAEAATVASLAVAIARVVSGKAALAASDGLVEVAGTGSAADPLGLNRHWRNARTHTLHDPLRWKVQHLGRHALTGVAPPHQSAF
jgi:SfnB family sulfur acquisition oxidoreductase